MGGITRLKGIGMFMEVMELGPVPIIPIWSCVWKYMLDVRPAEEISTLILLSLKLLGYVRKYRGTVTYDRGFLAKYCVALSEVCVLYEESHHCCCDRKQIQE